MGADLLAALALVLIIEGFLPGVAPRAWRQSITVLSQTSDATLRMLGIGAMVAGAVLLHFVL